MTFKRNTIVVEHLNALNNVLSESFEIPEQLFPVPLASHVGARSGRGESHSTFPSGGTRYCLIPVSSLRERELSTFSDKNFVLFALPLSSRRHRHSCLFGLVDIKAGERKREESSYRSRVREWKREREKSEEKERWAGRKLELENSSLTASFALCRVLFLSSDALSIRSKIIALKSVLTNEQYTQYNCVIMKQINAVIF